MGMEFETFDDPGICWPIVRRRAADELLVLLMGFGDALLTYGRSLMWNERFPSEQAYRSALYRLRKKGLLVSRRTSENTPSLFLTDEARSRTPAALQPEKRWRRKWPGYWYVLSYDVPETKKVYRETLRRFLVRMHMGCLQKSVWITPDDIRPEYQDLAETADVERFSFLLQSRTVLGRSTEDVVLKAWPFERLDKLQEYYCRISRRNLEILRNDTATPQELTELAVENTQAYLAAMQDDPMLPESLWLPTYRGREAYKLFKETTQAIARRL